MMIGSGMPSSQSSAPLPKPMSVSCVSLDRRLQNRAEVPPAAKNESHPRAERKPPARVLGHKCPAGRMYPAGDKRPRARAGATTRSRVSFFMNKFRKLGFIHYNGGIEVHSSLLNMVLHETPGITKGSDGS